MRASSSAELWRKDAWDDSKPLRLEIIDVLREVDWSCHDLVPWNSAPGAVTHLSRPNQCTRRGLTPRAAAGLVTGPGCPAYCVAARHALLRARLAPRMRFSRARARSVVRGSDAHPRDARCVRVRIRHTRERAGTRARSGGARAGAPATACRCTDSRAQSR
jgi:hypothetical protein